MVSADQAYNERLEGEREATFDPMSLDYFSAETIDYVLQPIRRNRVQTRDGNAYVAAHDVKAECARVFGVARWDWIIREGGTILHQQETKTNAGKDAWFVVARTLGDLIVKAPNGDLLATYSGVHVGTSTHPNIGEAMGNAIVNSDSYAFKRAAICALLDAGGLGLYNGGSTDALVRGTFVRPLSRKKKTEELPEGPAVVPESFERGMPDKDQVTTTARQPVEVTVIEDVPPLSVDDVAAAIWAEYQAITGTGRARTSAIVKLKTRAATARVLNFLVEIEGEMHPLGASLDKALRS